MTMTILYLNPCRRERLRTAFAHVITILGPLETARVVNALVEAYKPTRSTRTNYNYAIHALHYVVGLQGLAAIAILKEAWNEGCLAPHHAQQGQEPANIPTHPSTLTLQ